jgi:Na+-translocating ferredoxin:NAD+ oxidoreductase RnfG subunit
VGRDEGSFANHVHFPKDPAFTKMDSIVQFYCDISSEGTVETTHAVIGNNEAFKSAVQSALDWGRFKPASLDSKPTSAYLGGSVLFMHQDGQPIIVVSLATAERDRIGKLAHYVQPQLIGGLRRRLEAAVANASVGIPYQGASEVLVKISENGEIASITVVSENPKDIGLGDFLAGAIKDARFTPAYSDGKQTAGAINVIANFGEF